MLIIRRITIITRAIPMLSVHPLPTRHRLPILQNLLGLMLAFTVGFGLLAALAVLEGVPASDIEWLVAHPLAGLDLAFSNSARK